MAWKITRPQQAGLACVALLLLLPPVPSKISTDLVLEPGKEAPVRAAYAGAVSQVFVHEGDRVQEGQVLAVLHNAETEAAAQVALQELALVNGQLGNDEAHSNLEQAARANRDRTRLEQDLAVDQERVEGLQIRAPFSGVVTTPQVEQKTGEFLAAGDKFCEIADRSTMKARILVRDWQLEDVRPGASAQVKLVPYPYRSFSGHVERIMPAAATDHPVAQTPEPQRLGQDVTNYFAVEMVFPNPDGSLVEGMTGTAKISAKSYSLAWQAARGTWRWIRLYVWW